MHLIAPTTPDRLETHPPATVARAASGPAVRAARAAGALLLVMAVSAMFAEIGVRAALVVPDDAAETARRVAASPDLFRAGFVGYLFAFLLDVPVAILLYVALRGAGPTLALLAASFRLVYTAVVGAALLPYVGAMILVGDAGVAAGLEAAQRETLLHLCMTGFDQGFHLALVFFGVHLALLGPLLLRSRQVPRALGVLVGVAGVAYVLDNVLRFVAPSISTVIAPYVGALAMSEVALAVWLLVKGLRPRARS